ncbi:MAG: transporter [Bacteroidales bacterium]|nr:transporter [Bacteroidales bacterium]
MKKSILLFAILLMACICHAQEEDFSFPTDRPGNVWGTEVLPFHKISWENGFSYERNQGDRTIALPSTILRYGIFENVEVRVGTDFQLFEEQPFQTQLYGLTPLTIGTKIHCYDGNGILPSIGVLAQLQSPHVGSAEFLPDHVAPAMYLIFENDINDWFAICYNVGAEWDGVTATPTTFLGLNLGFSLTDDVSTYVETFNYLHPDGNQYMTEVGFTFSPMPRLQLDIEADFDVQQIKDYFRVGCGIAWRIN